MVYARCFILHYADNAMTDQCIASLLPQCAAVSAEIIVIDDGSPSKYVTEYPVTVVRHEQNLHLVPAFMKVVKQYPASVYGLLNNDLICHPDMLATVLTQFDDPDVGIVAPGSSDQGAGVLYVPHPGPWGNVVARHIDNHAIFIHHQVFEDIGMDECEDFTERKCWYWNRWLCYLARKSGYKVIAARDAYVDHLGGGYNAEADAAGLAWLKSRLGDAYTEAL
jgi:GT2 family glycosyltransferase